MCYATEEYSGAQECVQSYPAGRSAYAVIVIPRIRQPPRARLRGTGKGSSVTSEVDRFPFGMSDILPLRGLGNLRGELPSHDEKLLQYPD